MSMGGGGYVQGVCPGVPLPCDLSHDVCDVTYPHPGQNDGQMPVKTLPSRNYCCGG